MPSLTNVLYFACFAVLVAMAGFVYLKDRRAWLNRSFALTALALLAWLLTLFLFNRATDPMMVLLLGRANFAAVVFAVFLGYRFVAAVARKTVPRRALLLGETLLLFALTLFTPLIDRAEIPAPVAAAGHHTTVFGPLFPLYLLHVVGYLAAAVTLAFQTRRTALRPVRDQLALLGAGILATGLVSLITNALLPYAFGDFRFVDVGALSTILFLACVAWAIFVHRLFSVRLFIRKTLVFGLLLSFVLALYSSLVVLATERFAPEGAGALTQMGVLVIAFSFDPVRRFLEKRIDRLLFGSGRRRSAGPPGQPRNART